MAPQNTYLEQISVFNILPIIHISQIIWMAPRQESNHLHYCSKHCHYWVKRAELAFV